jgi:hypothetical protein
MKKILAASVAALALSSCTDGLEPQIYGTLSPSNFPSTEAEYELYTLEVYKPFQAKWGYQDLAWQNNFFSYEHGYIQLFEASTDLLEEFPTWGGFFEFYSKANFDFMRAMGRESHFEKVRFITRTTKIIDDLEKATVVSDAKKSQLIAEARMARGWAMYFLLHMYGPVPVITDPALIGTSAEAELVRPSREAFVNQIAEDLIFAADNLPQNPAEYGRFNKGLALGTLMRLYLNERNFQDAEEVGREIMSMGYALVTDYKSLFREATEKNTETIFAISCDPTADGTEQKGNMNAYSWYTYPTGFPGITQSEGGWAWPDGAFTATWEFYDSFDPADKRRELLIDHYTPSWGGAEINRASGMAGPVIMKYPDEGPGPFQGNDLPILRLADVMLMLAEAINENNAGPTQEAIDLVNEVRAKHGGLAGLAPEATASREAFNDAILQERAWDLFFEGVRKIDLIRHGKWESALQAVGKNPGPELFPLPEYAIIDSNGKLTQTPGY